MMKRKYGIFGPTRKQAWQEFAEMIDADYIDRGRFKHDQIIAYHRNWEITFDTYVVSTGNTHVTFTRIRAPFVKRDDFRFRIYREHIFSGIGKMLGMQDVIVGHEGFDKDFMIQGSDERKLKMLFDQPTIRELISYQPKISLKIQDLKGGIEKRKPQNGVELYYHIAKVLKNLTQLQDLYDLFCEMLDHLVEIGTADDYLIRFYYK